MPVVPRFVLATLAMLVAGGALAADPAGIAVVGGAGQAVTMTASDVAGLPAVSVAVAFDTEHGPRQATFEGPLLWTVLSHEGAIAEDRPRDAVRQSVLVAGRDGYTAVLALGEIAPAFEGKQVILAERMDGKALAPDQLRLVVPGDKRGGRSVRDVVRIAVSAPMTQTNP